MPPHRYHANRRIERAKQLLANRELTVTTIAFDVGFSDTSTFSAAFHRLTGQTPSLYRRNLD
jgi:AraC family transcriptional regulator